MNTQEFETKLLTIKSNWESRRIIYFKQLLSFINSTNPYSPLIHLSLREDWKNYKQFYSSFNDELRKEFPVAQLTEDQIHTLNKLKSQLYNELNQESICFLDLVNKRKSVIGNRIPLPSISEQLETGKILPDTPDLYQFGL